MIDKNMRNEKLKLPDNRKPSVLDRSAIWQSIKPDDYVEDEADKEYIMKTTRTLRLEFRQILKIDNLQDLSSLTRLFLDNNFIEKITGLDSLRCLVWLDLSFNKIRKIEGMEALKKLQVLALYQNEIGKLENLEHLTNLSVLRIGNNKLRTRDDIVYLRKLRKLRTLSIKGNPICDTEEWINFTISLLPNLAYLEIHPIAQEEREKASTKFQGDILRAEGREEQEAVALEKKKKQIASEKRHREAFVDTIKGEVLLKNLKKVNSKAEGDLVELILTPGSGASSLRDKYEAEVSELGDKIHRLGLKELEVREDEVKLFEESVQLAQVDCQGKGVKTVEQFLLEKESIFGKLHDLAADIEEREGEEVTDLQRDEVDKLREHFKIRAKETWSKVMAQELTLMTQTEQVLGLFEDSLNQLIDNFLGEAENLFLHVRNIDIRYFKNLSEIGERMEATNYEDNQKRNLKGSDSLLFLVALCHDGHQELLLKEEDKLKNAVRDWAEEYLSAFRHKERERNRTRVLELNYFLDAMKREEEELEIIPENQFEDDEML